VWPPLPSWLNENVNTPSTMDIATFQPGMSLDREHQLQPVVYVCCRFVQTSSCCEKGKNITNLILALNSLFLQAEAPYRRNFHPGRALIDKHTVYCSMQIAILNECSVLVPCFHTLNFIFTFSTIFHYLSHRFCPFFSSYSGKNLLG